MIQEMSDRACDWMQDYWKQVLDQITDCVVIVDVKSRAIAAANAVFERRFGYLAASLVGSSCHAVLFPGTEGTRRARHAKCPLSESLRKGRPVLMEHRVSDDEGRQVHLEISTSPLRDGKGEITHVVHVMRDVSERKAAEAQIAQLAYRDALTGLPNRTLLLDRLEQALRRAQREQRPLAVMMLNLDGFREVNESLGHDVGDRLLLKLSRRLQHSLRRSDTLARLGGDEFVVTLYGVREAGDVAGVARHLQDAAALPFSAEGGELISSLSVGIALCPQDGDTVEDLLKNAELALCEGKRGGRGKIVFHSSQMNERALERWRLESNLRQSISRRELYQVFQPQVDATTGQIVGMEALMRWNSPELGTVSPARFIPLAERRGIMPEMAEWGLRDACAHLATWIEQGLDPVRLSVNLSGVQLRELGLVDKVRGILEEYKIDPCLLEFELTESILIERGPLVRGVLDEFRALGITLALDDFGTGYSALSYLRNFPIDRIKVAQEFIRELPYNRDHEIILRAMLAMARSLGMDVVVEGVESPAQLELVKKLGGRVVQGYIFSRPLPEPEISQLLGRQSGGAALLMGLRSA